MRRGRVVSVEVVARIGGRFPGRVAEQAMRGAESAARRMVHLGGPALAGDGHDDDADADAPCSPGGASGTGAADDRLRAAEWSTIEGGALHCSVSVSGRVDRTGDSLSSGCVISAVATTSEGWVLAHSVVLEGGGGGRKKIQKKKKTSKTPEQCGEEAVALLRAELESGACLDEHATDQVLLFAALAAGETVLRVRNLSLHATTALELLRRLLGSEHTVEPVEGRLDAVILKVRGVGLVRGAGV